MRRIYLIWVTVFALCARPLTELSAETPRQDPLLEAAGVCVWGLSTFGAVCLIFFNARKDPVLGVRIVSQLLGLPDDVCPQPNWWEAMNPSLGGLPEGQCTLTPPQSWAEAIDMLDGTTARAPYINSWNDGDWDPS